MSYYSYELNEINPPRPTRLDPEIVAMLLTEDVVRHRLNQGENPILISIEKWERIADAYASISQRTSPSAFYRHLYEYIGYTTCALCLACIAEYVAKFGEMTSGNDRCQFCALASIDPCLTKGSTFGDIEDILYSRSISVRSKFYGMDTHQTLGMLITAMIEHLRASLKAGPPGTDA